MCVSVCCCYIYQTVEKEIKNMEVVGTKNVWVVGTKNVWVWKWVCVFERVLLFIHQTVKKKKNHGGGAVPR